MVTGGAQGIGKAISLKLMQQGVFVYVIDRDKEALEDFSQEASPEGGFEAVHCDVADAEALRMDLEVVLSKSRGIRYLVNNAGISEFVPMQQLELSRWNHILAVNLTACFLTVKYLEAALKQAKGAVVNISSTRALMSEPHSEAYAATKGGILALTHAQAISLQPLVRVNCISPGWIDVSGYKKKSLRQDIPWNEKHHQQHPAGRIGKPEDIASLAWWLLSDQGGFVTGQNFIADGGMTRKMIYEE